MNNHAIEPKIGRPVRLLLINPRFSESFWSFRWAIDKVLPAKTRAINPPLGLATLAALCPPDWEVGIIDENVESVPLAPHADIVGICCMAIQFPRQSELLGYYRRRGYYIVAGGSYASLCPEKYEGLADTVVAGEAETIWKTFCCDFMEGTPQRLYQESGVVDLTDSPTPRFELLKLDRYTTVTLQFSRGCPYRCDFCDIIVMFGRKPRTKTMEQVGDVFFVDDNLIGNRAVAKQLLRFLRDYQRRHAYRFTFGTEASLNVAEDDELLQLFREANFAWLFIGIESPDPESLKEARKTQNMRRDILDALRHIYAHGIDVLAGFIVGFDNDTLDTFERQYRFIMASGIQVAMVGLLTALPRTPLYERLMQEGRLMPEAWHADNTKLGTNFVPRRMSYRAMVKSYQDLFRRLVRDQGIAERVRSKTRYLRHPVYDGSNTLSQRVAILARLLARGLLPGGPGRLYQFMRSLPFSAPRAWPLVVKDWIAGLAMRDYVDRHFGTDPARERRLSERALAFIHRTSADCLHRGRSPFPCGPRKPVHG